MKFILKQKSNLLKHSAGFTLIELLVVISVITFLASIVMTNVSNARKKARDLKRKTDIAQLQKALEMYYAENNKYPYSFGAVAPNSDWSTSNGPSWTMLENKLKPYLSKLPHDPLEVPGVNQYSWANGMAGTWTGFYAYSYYSNIPGYHGCQQEQYYMIVYRLELPAGPDPGMIFCDGYIIRYGGGGPNTLVKTIGDTLR